MELSKGNLSSGDDADTDESSVLLSPPISS
jgi:hypothetical protein